MSIRRTVRNMNAYAWEESSRSIAKRYGLDEKSVIRFDMNTSPFVLNVVAEALQKRAGMAVNEYPPANYEGIVKGVANYLDVQERQVVVGAGGDEVIDTIALAFLEKGEKSVISTPTYSMFSIASQRVGSKVVEVPRTASHALDVDALTEAAQNAKLVWVCNPNSPTGNAEPPSKIRALMESTKATVVVDEAYAEFGGESVVKLTQEYENLVVVRTLSKAFGLAGARVGYAVTNPELAAVLNKLRLPNSVSEPATVLAGAALSAEGIRQMKDGVAAMVAEREKLKSRLEPPFEVFPSETNFLLIKFPDAQKQFKRLLTKGLVVRNLSENALTKNCLRITVRSPTQNSKLLEALT
ncbi:histidinol-phosphate transaminase [Candidatus Micrarchaeota archaeon]|nr:histidinol-phosphate transaminase [Candidatus Micrarchaeota archaeon]